MIFQDTISATVGEYVSGDFRKVHDDGVVMVTIDGDLAAVTIGNAERPFASGILTTQEIAQLVLALTTALTKLGTPAEAVFEEVPS